MSAALEQRVERLEARFELDELVSAYCMACDDHDMARLRGLFTDDVRIWSKDGVMNASGIEDVMRMFVSMFAIRGPSFHWTHDHTIRVSGPMDAEGLIMAHAETTPNNTVSLAAIRYRDKYRKEVARYKDEKEGIKKDAEKLEAEAKKWNDESDNQIHLHHRWAQAMTVIQVAIALAAITLLTRKKWMQTAVYIAAAGSAALATMAVLHI